MITPEQAAAAAEKAIAAYALDCQAHTPEDVRKMLEMLISKAARGIEKECGLQAAVDVLVRTVSHVAHYPQRAIQ